jgi:hypothetical protein
MKCSAGPSGQTYTHKGAGDSLLKLPKHQTLRILWPGGQQSTQQDGQAIQDVQFVLPLSPTLQRVRQGNSSTEFVEPQSPSKYPRVSMEYGMLFSVSLTSDGTNASQKDADVVGEAVPFMVYLDMRSSPMYSVSQQWCEWVDETTVYVFGQITIADMPGSLAVATGVLMWGLTLLTVLVAFGVMGSCTGIRTYISSCKQAFADPSQAGAVGDNSSTTKSDQTMIMKHGDILAFGSALLFALPTMRGLWPAAPPGGTFFDSLTIHPQLLLIAFALMLLLFKKYLVIREERAKLSNPPPPAAAAAAAPEAAVPAPPEPHGSSNKGASDNSSSASKTADSSNTGGAGTAGGRVELVVVPPTRTPSPVDCASTPANSWHAKKGEGSMSSASA